MDSSVTDIATEPKPSTGNALISLLYVARGLRGFGDGFAIIILPAYMTALGYDAIAVGIVATASLLGTALLTLIIGWIAPRHDLRALLIFGAGLMAATGLAFPGVEHFVLIVLVAFIGTINPSGGDLGVLVPLEHAVLAKSATDDRRTQVFARYSLIGALCTAAGSLAATLPDLLVSHGGTTLGAFRLMFYAYAALGILSAALYRHVPHARGEERAPQTPLGPSRGTVYKLAALFSIDAFAGGFVAQSLLVLWLFERFDLSLSAAGLFFFWSSTLSAFSYPVAAWIAKRIGLVNTMVFTHIPSSIFLILAAFSPNLYLALGLLLLRSALVANGCADPHLLRHGRGDAGGTAGGGQRHRRAAQPRIRHQPGHIRRAADDGVFRPAAGGLRHAQDRLRPRAAVFIPPHQAAGGAGLTRRERSVLRNRRLVEGCANAACQLQSIVVSPEMDEEHARLLVEHVAVDRGDFDIAGT